MTGVRFPKRKEDGSFTVLAKFTAAGVDARLVQLVSDYVSAWTRANRTWVRIWRSDVIQEERLEFFDEFASEPRVEADPAGGGFSVVLDGRSKATRWKDWAVFLINDISTVFPEVKFVRFES